MKSLSKLILFCIIVTGLILRLYHLDFQCLWTEELYTQSMIQLPIADIIIKSITSDFTPPLYYITAHFITPRLVSAICGIGTIIAMYFVGREYRDDTTGLYCAGFSAILFPMIYYSQFGRSYSMSILFFAITLLCYNKISYDNEFYEYLFIVFASLTIWVHLFNIIPIMFMLLYSERFEIFDTVAIAILTFPLIIPIYNAITIRTNTIASFGMSISELLYITPIEMFGSLYIPATILILYSCLNKIYTRLILVAVSTISVGILLSLYMPFFPRYFIVVDMIFILIISSVLSEFTNRHHVETKYLIIILILVFTLLFQQQELLSHYFTQQYNCNTAIGLL